MSERGRVKIQTISSGVPGLDQVLGGGLPEYSFNLIAGEPGSGKTTLAQQIMFANARPDRQALYFTVLGEPPLKMLRYQQAFRYFDPSRVDQEIRFVNLSAVVLNGNLSEVLDAIVREVDTHSPGLVFVDSFRTVVRATAGLPLGELELQSFVQRLALHLTSWQVTSFLVGEYNDLERQSNPVFTVADGVIWLYQSVERNSMVRKLQVVKMRGQPNMPGLHTFRIDENGVRVFPRISRGYEAEAKVQPHHRVSTGVAGLDAMLGSGIPSGDAVLLAGPSGSGKTVFAAQFITEGARHGEPGVIAVFEEHPADYLVRAETLGFNLRDFIDQNLVRVIYLRPLDLSVDEALTEISDAAHQIQAKRIVIDSLSGFELAVAPTFRVDFRESLYRMVGALTTLGVTVVMTVEVIEAFTDLRFSPHEVSFLADDIILQRYVELNGQLRKMITVVKMRSSEHSKDLRLYDVTSHGLEVGEVLSEYRGLITGTPTRGERPVRTYPGLSDQEIAALSVLVRLGEATAPALAQQSGLPESALTPILNRLLSLNYAFRVVEGGQTVYRPVAQPLGG